MERVCQKCSTVSQTDGGYCPSCGASFDRRSRWSKWSRRRRIATIAVPVVLAALIGGGLYTWKAVNDAEAQRVAAAQAEEERLAALRAQRQARRERELQRELRRSVVNEMEKSITSYAQRQSEKEFAIVEGPVLYTSCDPAVGSDVNDLAEPTMAFECLAVYKKIGGGQVRGTCSSRT